MVDPPAFLSFPDQTLDGENGANKGSTGTIRHHGRVERDRSEAKDSEVEVPSFSSFPDLDLGASQPRHAQKRKDRAHDREARGADLGSTSRNSNPRHRDEPEPRRDRERGHRLDERNHHDRDSKRKSDREKEKRRSEERRHREEDDDRGRYNSEDKRHRRRNQERDRDERRKKKEDRRERERRTAAELAEGEAKRSGESDADALAWYEGSTKRARTDLSDPPGPVSSKSFYVDTVGDRDVIRYGATSSFSTPRYRRDGGGRILGLSDGLRIVVSKDRIQKGVEVAPRGSPYIPRYSSRHLNSASRNLASILMRPKNGSSDLSESFTAFDLPRVLEKEAVKEDLPDYRAISRESPESEEELEAIQAIVGKASTLEDIMKVRTASFEQHLRSSPDDAAQWIEYSKLHLQLSPEAATSSAFVDTAKQPTNRANAEVTLSILSRALEAHPANLSSPELHIAYLRAAELFWPPTKVTERWENVIRQLGENGAEEEDLMRLYLGYIQWRQGQGIGQTTTGGTGGVDEVVSVYLDCLQKLRTGRARDQEAREENQVYLLLRACLFLKQAGFSERALAVFQAMLEVTFFKPDHLRQPAPPFDRELWFTGVLMEFEDFWDSEVARVGEDGGQGWKAAISSSAPDSIPTSSASEIPPSEAADPYIRWLDAERNADRVFTLPGRATDLDAPDDDPCHVVLYSDIAPLLFAIQTPGARLQLIYAFFTFLGLPFSPPDVPTSSAAATDPHLRWTLSQNATLRAAFWPPKQTVKRIAWQTVGGEPMEPEQKPTLASPFGSPVKSWMSQRGTLFASKWFRDLEIADLGHVNVPFTRNILTTLRPLVPDPSFLLATFAFEAAISHKAAIKLARSVLETDRDNLALWDGYARLERQRDKVTAARQVYITAIQATEQRIAESSNAAQDLRLDEKDLWAAWAEMEWEEGLEDRCLEVLVMSAGAASLTHIADCCNPDYVVTRPTAISLLKTKQYFETSMSESPSNLALGTLHLTLTEGIEAARDRLLTVVQSLSPGHPLAEETYQILTRLIYTYTSRHASPASLARNVLARAIAAFPSNTTFLSLYLWGETGGRVYGRIHSLVTRLTNDENGVVSLLWSVWAEAMTAGRMFWNGAERVRRALDRGINTTVGKHSAALWMLYIEFEMLMGKPAAAKALCYRAIAAVGGCKDLYLLPFSLLRQHFANRELRSMAELMAERGIRMRVPTEIYWEDVDTDDEEQEEDRLEGDDEYGMLRDREELKPY